MQKLLWIGEAFFAPSLSQCGWEHVAIHSPEKQKVYSWQDLIKLAGFIPDVLVVADNSSAPFVLGVEDFPCLTVFYSVESHHHAWHGLYAQAFDACLVSLKDHLDRFSRPFLDSSRVWWSPPFASENAPCETQKIYDCLYIGRTRQKRLPKRQLFLQELAKKTPNLAIRSGSYQELVPQGRVILNYSERGALDFKVFEAMGYGAALVTPRVGHGLDKLFVDGEHLVCYAPDDPGDAAYRINFLLENPDLCEYISQTAFSEINSKHRPQHRAEAFTDHLCDLFMQDPEGLITARKEKAKAIRANSLAVPYFLLANQMRESERGKAFAAAGEGKFGLNGISL